jgi:hypothetical protein
MYLRDGDKLEEIARGEGKDLIEAMCALREYWRRRV